MDDNNQNYLAPNVHLLLAFLNFITKNRITPTNSNDTKNDMVIIYLSLL
jgi:hypothetical protein